MAGDFASSGPRERSGDGRARPAIRGAPAYGLAIAALGVATAVRTALDPLLGDASPYVSFFAMALALFLVAGPGPALLEAVAGGIVGIWLFVEPRGSVAATKSGAAGLVVYLVVVAATLQVLRSLREARATAERRQAELLAAEAVMRAQREAWRATLASIAEAVVATDRNGRVTFLNDVAERLLGQPSSRAIGRPLGDVVSLAGLGEEILDRALRQGKVFTPGGPIELAGPGGADQATPVEVVASPILGDAAGDALGAVVVLRDVSAARRAAVELGEAKEAAEAANRAKDRFLKALGHELRTPLTPVLLGVSYIIEGPDAPAPLRPTLEMIRRNVEAEARLIDDLLDVVQMQRGTLIGSPQVVDTHLLIHEALDSCRAALDAASVEPTLALEAEPYHVWADPHRFRQAIANLLRNAAKFSPGGGRVSVRTRAEPGGPTAPTRLIVEVTDAGIGLDPAALATLFQPFDLARRDPTSGGGGLGLGLAICRAIVAGAGGAIAASSDGPGRGATFTLTFDALPEPDPAVASTPSSDSRAAPRPLRILVVDDDEPTRRVLTAALASLGHAVRTADSVASAADAVRASFDVLLCDIGLPDGTGYDVLRLLDSRPVRAIALSGFGLDDDLRKSRASGFAEHLTKPIDLHTLDAAIRRAAAGA
jgi:PAS domain S-box-containing protein